ncbi:PEP-CTERM sorting domain-containing protein [Planctomyces sp. SH-PL62]|uniref:PEP-CTERM sorting domain-containing protein n=1 Tax=Planctomyces sp. SH-PL62 TaxID=1636152 RepID=UPI00078B8632|nr:PEP-CTERM sorting domain-containing protein [Planctomyces sp. SH-PL62]AMV38018.1 PEP-CTERM motif protein [Planctomyces sp. SH-PL62]
MRIDGVDVALPPGVASLLDFRQLSPPGTFPLTFPADNIYGVDEGTYESVSDGYWVALAPLAPGTYQLDFGGAGSGTPPIYGPFSNTQTYFITVVPEPSSVVLLGLGAGLGVVGLRRRHARPKKPRGAMEGEIMAPPGR